MLGVIGVAVGKTIPELMQESACFKCMSESQMLHALVTILGNDLLGEEHTPQEIIDEMHCLVCVPSKHDLLAAILYRLCHDIGFTIRQ